MGRHAETSRTRVRIDRRGAIAGAAVLALIAGGLVWWTVAAGGRCDPTRTVRVTVTPEMGDLAERLLAEPQELDDGSCAAAAVETQEPLQTLSGLGTLEEASLPEVWVPDSSQWPARAPDGAALDPGTSVAMSPVVLATSTAVVDELGWGDLPPSWADALTAGRPLALPDVAESAVGISALSAVRASLGSGEDADKAIVEAVLAAERGPAVSVQDALAQGRAGDADAPLVPVREQELWAAGSDGGDSQLAVVYPGDGSPALDYPVVRVGSPSAERSPAIDAVVRRLTSDTARQEARQAGFRDPDGGAPARAADVGLREESPDLIALEPADVRALLSRLAALAAPSRILAVFDVSTSMEAPVGNGTRATLERDAAKSALSLVPGDSAIGLWVFAARLDGDSDHRELTPTRRLDADVDGRPQRDVLAEQLDTLPDLLAPGGTGLYDTTLAAVRAARSDYNPDAVNSVLIVTDGTDEDDRSIGLRGLLDTLEAEADPDRPVKVIAVALGPDADLGVLQQIAEVTGGAAYSAVDPADLQDVLFDAIRQRQQG